MLVLPSQRLLAVKQSLALSTHIIMQEGKGGKTMVSNAFIHSADPDSTAINTQSVLENNDLTELMSMVSQQKPCESTLRLVHLYTQALSTDNKQLCASCSSEACTAASSLSSVLGRTCSTMSALLSCCPAGPCRQSWLTRTLLLSVGSR